MTAEQIIIKKRNGVELTEQEIRFMIDGLLGGEVTEYQMSALLMAIYFQGMTFDENYVMTKVMVESGEKARVYTRISNEIISKRICSFA